MSSEGRGAIVDVAAFRVVHDDDGSYELDDVARRRDEQHFPGMQPVGIYPIHIIVKNGRTMLLGIVDSAADRQIAEGRAREVTGVFGVENSLTVAR